MRKQPGLLKQLCAVARLNFLSLTLVCIVLAAAVSWYQQASLSVSLFALVLMMALAAHISVNAFNEYFDFKSGLDFLTDKTPFSGGSGTLVHQPDAASATLALACLSLLWVVGSGLYLSALLGWQLLLIGIPGVLIIYTYTQYINRSALLCLLAPGLGFGLLMTTGASWVFSHALSNTLGQTLGQALSSSALLSGAIVSCLVSNLLLLNQFPDVEADRQVGRCHYPILLGRQHSSLIFAALLLFSYLLLVLGIAVAALPPHSLLVLLSLPLAFKLQAGVRRYAEQPAQLVPYLALNVGLIHLYIVLLALSLLWAEFSHGAS
jgi:1,4-dihydroxy-2-naphthoate octaprenyltransferase